MPLGKYHCDYCNKEFQDTPFARKRHLQSLQHLRAKALWYDSLKDTNPHKGVCNRFLQTGFCPYGDSCKYFHPNNSSHPQNTVQVPGFIDHVQSSQVVPRMQLSGGSSLPGLENVQSSAIVSRIQSVGGRSLSGDVMRDSMGMSWGNLPPSLKPPPEGGYPPLPFVDWG
ncbi:hypothetical protein LWI28_027360 [Acer negundo]|uniref:C3H1-type domain-containing protein n=1 Tax=Acer negundo TaxID=4023 RepID=A0AAD5IAZ1_ACENE|nr:hypothetical protein LWI28_027360 [Acer negundo]KAK4836652.1 hypothetical protein QYF36_025761 [Acer negundo]